MFHPHRLCVGGRLSVQDLANAGNVLAGRITREPVYGKPRTMREQAAQGDLTIAGMFVFRHLPGMQLVIDIRIQLQFSV